MTSRIQSSLLVGAAFVMMAGMHLYFNTVVIPSQETDAAAHGKPRGNLSDLYPRWFGARELLLHNRDPYSAEVTRDIQSAYWGREIDPKKPNDPTDENRFAYPLYVVFLLAPTVMLPFRTVQLLYMWGAAGCMVVSVWLWLYVFGRRRSTLAVVMAGMLLLGSYPVVQALHLQQPALLVAVLLAVAVAATARGMYWVAGIALGLSMIKPQSAGALAAWLLLWSMSGWKQRKFLFIAFAATMTLLCAGAEWLLPGWIWEWRDATVAYTHYTGDLGAYVQLVFGNYLGAVIRVMLLVAALVICWISRRDAASTDRFKFTLAVVFAVSIAVNPVWHSYDLMFLLPVALLIFSWWDKFVRLQPLPRAVITLSMIGLAWQWLAATSVSALGLASPDLARSLEVLPWLSVFFGPSLALVALSVIAVGCRPEKRPEEC